MHRTGQCLQKTRYARVEEGGHLVTLREQMGQMELESTEGSAERACMFTRYLNFWSRAQAGIRVDFVFWTESPKGGS